MTQTTPQEARVNGFLKTVNDNLACQIKVAYATYDCAIAANLAIAAHGLGVIIPDGAFIMGGFVDVITKFDSDSTDAGELAISVLGADDIIAATAVSGAPYSTTGKKAIVPKFNTPESTGILTTSAKEITVTVSVEAMLTGKLHVVIFYIDPLLE